MDRFIHNLKERLSQPLPGKAAHARMSHQLRPADYPAPPDAKQAGVLILLYPKQEDWHTVLMKRTSRFKNDRHKGQVSFPGGGEEPQDTAYGSTALREAHEEVGVIPQQVELIGHLSELYIPVSNYLVHPFVGYAQQAPRFVPDPVEVADIIETPISLLTDTRNHKRTDMLIHDGFKLRDVPYFDVNGHVVWGATCMIINELVHILEEIGRV